MASTSSSTLSYLIKLHVYPFQIFSAFQLGDSLSAGESIIFVLESIPLLIITTRLFIRQVINAHHLLLYMTYYLLSTNQTPLNLRKNWRREVKKILVVLQHNKANNHTGFQFLLCSPMLNWPNVLVKYDFGELFIVITQWQLSQTS